MKLHAIQLAIVDVAWDCGFIFTFDCPDGLKAGAQHVDEAGYDSIAGNMRRVVGDYAEGGGAQDFVVREMRGNGEFGIGVAGAWIVSTSRMFWMAFATYSDPFICTRLRMSAGAARGFDRPRTLEKRRA